MWKRPRGRPRLTCTTGFLFLAAALLYLDGQGLVLQGALVCALHELGHWGAITLLGGRVRALRLTAVGAQMELDPGRVLSYSREAAAALAGPGVNLALAWLCALGGRYLPAGMHLCFGLLNLLPIRSLDGGRALFCALAWRWPTLAERLLEGFSLALAGGLLGVGLAAWRRWGNISLLGTAAWLLWGTLGGRRHRKADRYAAL